jgi:hypothetical protein
VRNCRLGRPLPLFTQGPRGDIPPIIRRRRSSRKSNSELTGIDAVISLAIRAWGCAARLELQLRETRLRLVVMGDVGILIVGEGDDVDRRWFAAIRSRPVAAREYVCASHPPP